MEKSNSVASSGDLDVNLANQLAEQEKKEFLKNQEKVLYKPKEN